MPFDPNDYGTQAAALLRGAPLNELGPGSPDASVREALAALTPEAIVAPGKLIDREMALACLAGLWLRHDFLDESHRISQDLESSSGSYWHGIMHRREPDYDNSKYWFRRVGAHPVFAELTAAAREPAAQTDIPAARSLREQDRWDPFGFVELCRAAVGNRALETLCRRVQQREWELLFDHCHRRAAGQ